jgi:hypothetical protein
MGKYGHLNHMHSLLIDLQYLIADITNEIYKTTATQHEIDLTVFYEACVVDIAARRLILSIQSVLSDMTEDELSAKTTFSHLQ